MTINQVSKIYSMGTQPAGREVLQKSGGDYRSKDSIGVSERARILQIAMRAMSQPSSQHNNTGTRESRESHESRKSHESRESHLEELRTQIYNGTYKPSSSNIASAIISGITLI